MRTSRRVVLTVLSAVLTALPAAAQQVDAEPVAQPAPTAAAVGFPDARSGEEAIALLGPTLDAVALRNGFAPEELEAELRDDPTLWATADGRLIYVDRVAPAGSDPSSDGGGSSYSGSIPTSEAFLLHTNPDAKTRIYLDFDGHHSKANGWGHNIVFPAWNTSGSPNSFTQGELESIIVHWQAVAEDFAPWDVDVTTEEPPEDDLTLKFIGDERFGVRVVMTQPTQGFGNGIGGVAQLNTFGYLQDTPVFGFNKGDNNGSMTASHEVGHAMGMFHDGLNSSEYHPGSGNGATGWGPIMGAPFGKTLVQWSNGDYAGSSTTQNDAGIVGGKPSDKRPDEAPDTVAEAVPLGAACPSLTLRTVQGIIGGRNDVDAWSFTTSGGSVTLGASPSQPYPNLDIELALYEAGGALIEIDQPTNQNTAAISRNLAAGTYVVMIDGVGKEPVYSDYGSIGQYTLEVNAPAVDPFTNLGSGLAGTGGVTPLLTGAGTPCAGEQVTIALSAAVPNTTAWLVFGFGQLGTPFRGGTMVPDFNAAGGFLPIPVGGSGSVALPTPWPADVPPGLALVTQFWVQDGGGPAGFAASNGLELLSP